MERRHKDRATRMDIFKDLGHLAVRVTNLQSSLDFYSRLGFREMTRLLNDKGEAWIVYLRINDDQYLELFPGGEGPWSPRGNGTGIFHMCLTVDNLDEAEARLAKAGVNLSQPRKPGKGLDNNRGMWIADPDGNQIEIMEMAPDCIQVQAIERLRRDAAAART
jgi:catechol 2,3-dioxygenase-like lactoylglutathione lyase family enzyme